MRIQGWVCPGALVDAVSGDFRPSYAPFLSANASGGWCRHPGADTKHLRRHRLSGCSREHTPNVSVACQRMATRAGSTAERLSDSADALSRAPNWSPSWPGQGGCNGDDIKIIGSSTPRSGCGKSPATDHKRARRESCARPRAVIIGMAESHQARSLGTAKPARCRPRRRGNAALGAA